MAEIYKESDFSILYGIVKNIEDKGKVCVLTLSYESEDIQLQCWNNSERYLLADAARRYKIGDRCLAKAIPHSGKAGVFLCSELKKSGLIKGGKEHFVAGFISFVAKGNGYKGVYIPVGFNNKPYLVKCFGNISKMFLKKGMYIIARCDAPRDMEFNGREFKEVKAQFIRVD